MWGRKRCSSGLIVEIGDGDSYTYRGHLFYDLVKTTVIRMAFAMARELRRKNVAAVALTPGFLRSEAMLEHFGVTEANWRDAVKKDPNYSIPRRLCLRGVPLRRSPPTQIFRKSPDGSSAPGTYRTNTAFATRTVAGRTGEDISLPSTVTV